MARLATCGLSKLRNTAKERRPSVLPKYGNSLRMRLAMRLTVANPSLAQSEFEDAAKGEFIASMDDIAQVAKKDGWDPRCVYKTE